MAVDRVKFQDIVESQLPRYVREDFPLLVEFLEQYYVSQEYPGGAYDLIQNIDKYVKVEELSNLKTYTILESDLNYTSRSITASVDGNFTEGFPETNGIIKIDNEIIEYDYKTDTTFEGCTRGFSGITSYISPTTPDQLVFRQSEIDSHKKGATIHNLNIIFLQEFFTKLKKQFVPGFTERNLYSGLNQKNFVYNADSFYASKGTDESFKILFRALYGETVEVIKPSTFLLRPSDADYQVTQDFVVERVNGNPLDLKNRTLYQDSTNSRGTVTNVEKIHYDGGDFYQISVDGGYQRDISDKGSIFGDFKPNNKTQLLNSVGVGATFVDVDSTVGFPTSGFLVGYTADNDPIGLAYTGKNANQFLSVTGVTEILPESKDIRADFNSYANVGTGSSIEVRITSTLTELQIPDATYHYKKDDTVRIQSLGLESNIEPSKNWKFNIKTKWTVRALTLLDSSERSYDVETWDDQFLQPGYLITLIDDAGQTVNGSVTRVISATKFIIRLSGLVNVTKNWTIKNDILKGNSTKYTQLQSYFANIQNTYVNFNDDVLVASNSLPNYPNLPTNPYDKKVTFSGSPALGGEILKITTGTDHGFFTGDAVFYQPGLIRTTVTTPDGVSYETVTESKFNEIRGTSTTSLDAAVYYIKRVDAENVKLARSRADIYENDFIILSGTVDDNQLIYFDFYQKIIEPQQIYREITAPVNKSGDYTTEPGYTGILINGVEILNYKSQDIVFYGDLQSFNVTSGGSGYDVINPPAFVVQDVVGTGATGTCAVSGQLERLEILDKGFDFTDTPIIKISGGNPTEIAKAEVNVTPIIHSVEFNAERTGTINVTNDTIGFSTFHKFTQNEQVIYDPQGGRVIAGLSTNAFYYIGIVNSSTIKLYNRVSDSTVGINTVDLTNYGGGSQIIQSTGRKRVVTSVIVTDSGKGYQNKKRVVTTVGVSTALDRITITNHGYKEKEVIEYAAGTPNIVGLSTNEKYYVRKIDDNTFSLSLVGTGNTVKDFYYANNIITNLRSTGDGSFNYEPIKVTVSGTVGVTTFAGQDFQCKVQPIFRGSIDSVDNTNKGVGYGSSEILNFNRQPYLSFESGKGALLTPIINNGKIVEVVVNSPGSGYNSPPNLVLTGSGQYAQLVPIVNGGRIAEVKVINGGVGFTTSQTFLTASPAGSNARVDAEIREWNVNVFERDFENIKDDDGFLDESIDNSSIEYCSLYAPRPLRESTYSLAGESVDNTNYGIADLQIENGIEVASNFHSPILGWAYDGNPIYGPYGYTNPDGGTIKQIESGYELQVNAANRPAVSIFPGGFFIEDYTFTERGDLDEHNGRFCITPDYPKGRYCYFTTLNSINDSSGPFTNYKRPAFPYLIGNTFSSKPNLFNWKLTANQTEYDIENDKWFRNTKVYHTNDSRSGYDYIFNSNTVKEQVADIKGTSIGNVQSVGILTGGTGYKVNERIVFDNTNTDGQDAAARVERISGKVIDTISTASTIFSNVEFTSQSPTQYIGFSSIPHGLEDLDLINISALSENLRGFEGSYNIGIRSDNFVLTLGVGNTAATGITTYFYVSGILQYPNIRENDILGIGTEKVKVLNIDRDTSRIRVLREYGDTVGTAYTNLTVLFEDPRKFNINVGTLKTDKTFRINREIYFDPAESVGLGTVLGVGAGTTLPIGNPGVGLTEVFVPPQQIYYKEHGLSLNDMLYYNANGGTTLQIWGGDSTNPYTNLTSYDFVYAAPISRDYLGISTTRVGMTSTGYVGVNTVTGLAYFTNAGSGVYHSFKTSLSNVITGQVDKNIVTVSTASTHGLKREIITHPITGRKSIFADDVYMSVKPINTVTVTVKYNDFNRRIVFNPLDFVAGDIDIIRNTITFNNHDFKKGDKIIHTSSSPAGGLVNQKMYYVIPYSGNKIRLVTEKFQVDSATPDFVDITSASTGTISKINPLVEIKKNQKLKFDLSDSSLSFIQNSITYSAFSLDLFSDNEFNNLFLTSGSSRIFDVTSSGSPGIDATANVTLSVGDDVPTNLYYKFIVENLDIVPALKKEIIIDKDLDGYNQINIVKTAYDGKHTITGIGTTTFTFNVATVPDTLTFNASNAVSSYETTSVEPTGSITKVKIIDPGMGYKALPGISTVTSGVGTGAILESVSTNIGSILNSKMEGIGFDYATDSTLRAVANLPEILEMEQLASFDSIGIASVGRNYLLSPTIVVIDGFTNDVIDDLELFYTLGDEEVTIRENTTGMYNTPPRLVPTQNSNGVGIASLTWEASSKTVTLYPDTTFSDASDFPYNVGEKILVENISVGVGSTGTGYNSQDYNYKLFTVTDADAQLGGTGSWIQYKLTDVLGVGATPGVMDISNSAGRVIAEQDFPIYAPILRTNEFFKGEKVSSVGKFGHVESWDSALETLKITTSKEFVVGDIVRGLSSDTQGVIKSKIDFDAEILIGAGATVNDGWQTNTGFLNDSLQRLPNNEYYQNFSYSIKSRVPLQTWEDPVSVLNHTSGFAKFSDLVVESTATGAIALPEDSNIEIVNDIIGEVSLYETFDYDYVTEGTIEISRKSISQTIDFENRSLTDFYESVGNRVLTIDDMSGIFNSNPRATKYNNIAEFTASQKYNKIFTLVQDTTYTDERMFSIVSLIQDDSLGYINEYGTIYTYPKLGTFDYLATADGFDLTFVPVKFEYNSYQTASVNLSILNDRITTEDLPLGTSAIAMGATATVAAGTATTIIALDDGYRSAKINVLLEDTSKNFFAQELNVIHDFTDVSLLEYGDLTAGPGASSAGFGTFGATLKGGNINIDFHPNVSVALTANSSIVAISTNAVGVGSTTVNTARITSSYVSIAATASPTANVVSTYASPFQGGYYFVSVEDTTTKEAQCSELGIISSDSNEALVEFANLETGGNIGTVGIASVGGNRNIVFTPIANVATEVRIVGFEMQQMIQNTDADRIDLNNVVIDADEGVYQGTQLDVRTSFGLKHDGLEIFRRSFDGGSSSVVDISNNALKIPDHYFVTGEEIQYSYAGAGTTQCIGITSVSVAGIGTTDKLPHTLYAVKVDAGSLRFAETAEDALAEIPTVFEFNSVGIGTSHSIRATNENSKALVAIDNMIQSPITNTAVNTTLSADITFDTTLTLAGVTSIFTRDLLKVGNEIVIVEEVGKGAADKILVRRASLGTKVENHTAGTAVTKIAGNYNIVDNTLHFSQAPYGQIPLSTTTGNPDYRDWVGISTNSTFQGRTFIRSGVPRSPNATYNTNYVFDDLSSQFTGIQSFFELKSGGSNVTGFSTDNSIILINSIFQEPQGIQAADANYDLAEKSGITTITFTGSGANIGYDSNVGDLPRGGVIVSVGSTDGFGYQPLVSAGGTAIVSGLGTISSISIGNTGSGYRPGIQTTINVGVQTYSDGIANVEFIGTAAVSNGGIVSIAITNPGAGYTTTNPPDVVFDAPWSYTNLPLIYTGSTGAGQNATADIVVGQGSSIVEFEVKYFGSGFGNGDKLTVAVGGTTGIPTTTVADFEEFQLTVERIHDDTFNGWSVGVLEVLDKLDAEFDGSKTAFRLKLNDEPFSVRSAKGSAIEVDKTLLVFINEILQEPEVSYTFKGGSVITFAEPPDAGDKSKILFYKGTGELDVTFTEILETVKVGDILEINNNPSKGQGRAFDQDPRVVTGINTVDSVSTAPYVGPGITTSGTLTRPVNWKKQTEDRIIDSKPVGKDRPHYEPLIYPTAYLIQPVGIDSTFAYVDSVRPYFNSVNEQQIRGFQNIVEITSQDTLTGAAATAIVSAAGTITSLSITNAGVGYTQIPEVSIASAVGFGTTTRATATATISGGAVSALTVTGPGTYYSSVPEVLIGPPELVTEKINVDSYNGDYGAIVGIGTTLNGSQDQLAVDLFIPYDSYLRSTTYVGSSSTLSGISTSDYFTLYGTNLSIGSTFASQNNAGVSVGIATTALDCVYQVQSTTQINNYNIPGIGNTGVIRVFTNVDGVGSGIISTRDQDLGEFSWGKINFSGRTKRESFNFYGDNGYSGISSSGLVTRFNPLKYTNYLV